MTVVRGATRVRTPGGVRHRGKRSRGRVEARGVCRCEPGFARLEACATGASAAAGGWKRAACAAVNPGSHAWRRAPQGQAQPRAGGSARRASAGASTRVLWRTPPGVRMRPGLPATPKTARCRSGTCALSASPAPVRITRACPHHLRQAAFTRACRSARSRGACGPNRSAGAGRSSSSASGASRSSGRSSRANAPSRRAP